MCESIPEMNYESPHKNDPEWKKEMKWAFRREYHENYEKVKDDVGKWKCIVAPTAPAFSGPLHILCLCLAETGHLNPLLRMARACCARDTVGRVSFVTNSFGASKVAKWLQTDPEKTGKLALYAFEDAWNESLQTQCNWFAQNEDGSLMGISNCAISKNCTACLQELVGGKLPVSCILQDMASFGYGPMLDAARKNTNKIGRKFQALQDAIVMSAPATILGAFIFKGGTRTLIHCFMAPQLVPMLKMMEAAGTELDMKAEAMKQTKVGMQDMLGSSISDVALPPNVRAVGIIADEAKADKLPQDLADFLERPGPVVYVSMGSVAAFTEEQLAKVCEGLRAPGEWRVIWSLRKGQQDILPEGGVKALGDDFLVSAWLPQVDLLMHKKVQLFVSHCGWGATCEAIISGTPVVSFPMFADQNANALLMNVLGMAKTVTLPPLKMDIMDPMGMAKQLDPMMAVSERLRNDFTPEMLREDIRLVLGDKKFLTAARQTRSMNFMYKGGAHKAAEEVETACYELNPNLKR
uniref:UDP-glycosyltransferases domain-containing protein n=1 Tax=Alexandrium catenella TaxID=2925 RepID=A0A7S1MSG3_ALECA